MNSEPKNIKIDNLLLFKCVKHYDNQSMYISCRQYIEELDMNVEDTLFLRNHPTARTYSNIGHIKAINGNKVIVGFN